MFCPQQVFATQPLIARVADRLRLSEEERNQQVARGSKTTLASNVSFAKADLLRARLIHDAGGGFYAITDRGREVLSQNPPAIDHAFLRQFPEFAAFVQKSPGEEVQAALASLQRFLIGQDTLKEQT